MRAFGIGNDEDLIRRNVNRAQYPWSPSDFCRPCPLLGRLFGKKVRVTDSGVTVTAIFWRGPIYVTKVEKA